MRMSDIRKLQEENVGLKKEIQNFRVALQEKDEQIFKIVEKLTAIKEKKNAKVKLTENYFKLKNFNIFSIDISIV